MISFTCDCCGEKSEGDSALDSGLPIGWISVCANVNRGQDKGVDEWFADSVHACEDCSVHMDMPEICEAITKILQRDMKQEFVAGKPPPLASV